MGNLHIYWKEIDVQAKSIPEKTYSIGYSTQAVDFKKIYPYPKEILLKGEFHIEPLDIVVYEKKDEILY